MSQELSLLDGYNIDRPEIIGEVINFYPDRIESLYTYFEKEIDNILPFLIPNFDIIIPKDDDLIKSFIIWRNSITDWDEVCIENFSGFYGKNSSETIKLLWHKAKIGLLRYGV